MDKISYVILIVFLVYFIGMFVWILVRKHHNLKQQKKELEHPMEAPTLVVVGATVASKEMTSNVEGNPRMPKRKHVFTVCFVTDDGQKKVLEVPQSVFETLSKGDSGALALQNDKYYDFLKGEIPARAQETAFQNQE